MGTLTLVTAIDRNPESRAVGLNSACGTGRETTLTTDALTGDGVSHRSSLSGGIKGARSAPAANYFPSTCSS